jgi:hypothetical protein
MWGGDSTRAQALKAVQEANAREHAAEAAARKSGKHWFRQRMFQNKKKTMPQGSEVTTTGNNENSFSDCISQAKNDRSGQIKTLPLQHLSLQHLRADGTLTDLPSHVVVQALAYCSARDILLASSTCKFVGHVSFDSLLWRSLRLPDTSQEYAKLARQRYFDQTTTSGPSSNSSTGSTNAPPPCSPGFGPGTSTGADGVTMAAKSEVIMLAEWLQKEHASTRS